MSIARLLDVTRPAGSPDALYEALDFGEPAKGRPAVFINMAATVDGKIVIGEPGGTAKGVGGPTDQLLFRRLQRQCDAVLVGASTLRAGPVLYPPELLRVTVTRSANLPAGNPFFTRRSALALVAAPEEAAAAVRQCVGNGADVLEVGSGEVDLTQLLGILRQTYGRRLLLCEGGPTLNSALIMAGLADELFLTISPKLKGGSGIPSIMAGAGLPPGRVVSLDLLSVYADGSELYLRYRIGGVTSL
ncbi:MAG: RibD family protein [Armatimonadetes bacterium]|nr:RibD family protein [Armatimonadota bacterium]MDE2206629.1 RibD family protein [Armatimonadota bacterium]